MRFSIWPSPAQSWDEIHEITAHCEQTGWDGVYFADHFMPNGPGTAPLDGDTLECWSVIAALAALVPRMRLAPLVTSVTYRHPAVLAQIAAAVDHVSHARPTLGGPAGSHGNETAAHGQTAARDPGKTHAPPQARLSRSRDTAWLREKRQARPGPPVIAGTPGEVTAIIARYQDAGADELIVPDVTLGSMARKKDTCDLFMQQVAPAFR